MAATGSQQHVGWVGSGSGFLVRDLNHDGVINNGTELFGNATLLASGAKAQDGFAALSSLDLNHDGVINNLDAVYNELGVWVDANQDGLTQAGEIHSLRSLHIAQLNLNASHTAVNNNGNWVTLDSTYTTTDGTTHEMADVWFQKDAIDISSLSTAAVASLTADQIQSLSTAQVATLSNDQVHALTTAQISALTPDQVHAMTTAEISALSPDQIAALTTADIAALTNDQVGALTADDMAALHNLGKDSAFSESQHHAMDASQLKTFAHNGLDSLFAVSGNDHTIPAAIAGNPELHASTLHQNIDDVGALLTNGPTHVAEHDQLQVTLQGVATGHKNDPLIG
jgi:DNA polymerase III psi subunit